MVIGGRTARDRSAGRRADRSRGFVRLGYGTGHGSYRGNHGVRGRHHGSRGYGSLHLGFGLGLGLGHPGLLLHAAGHRWYDHGYRRPYYDHYRHYRRAYGSIYGAFGTGFYPSYGYYGYDPYYSQATLIDYAYRPLLPSSYGTTIVYAQGTDSIPPPVTEAYYTSPAQALPPAQPVKSTLRATDLAPTEPGSAVPPESTTAQEVTSWVELGNTAFAAERYDEARHLYMRAVLADDDDGYAKLFYGLANFALGDYGAAATAVRRALQSIPDLIEDPIDLRVLYTDELVVQAHLARLKQLVETRPGDREARFLLGYLYYATGAPVQAQTVLQSLAGLSAEDELVAFVSDAVTRVVNLEQQGDK